MTPLPSRPEAADRVQTVVRRLAILLAVLMPLAALVGATPVMDASNTNGHGGGCAEVAKPHVSGARILSVAATERPAGTVTTPPQPPYPTPPPIAGVPARCVVSLTLTHPGVGDRVRIDVWLPVTGWNGRFQGTGGGGFAAGSFDYALAPAVKNGYAAASTDAGVGLDSVSAATWALDEHGNVNKGLLTNFASRSVHEMSLIGEQVIASFYGRRASHSYWNGCSTGGRQGMMEAQRYPRDFDGIVASAPATDMDRLALAHLWPFVVMNQEHAFPTGCELEAFNQAAIAGCDHDDGVTDGVIGQPERCEYDPGQLVGKTIPCEDGPVQITEADARVVRKIWDGPRSLDGTRLWYGLPRGTPFDPLAAIATSPDGIRKGVLFPIADEWIRYFLKRQPSFDPSIIGYRDFEQLFEQSHDEYGDVVGTGDPDLSGFRDAGGKMIAWHGLADRLIPFQDTIDYRRRVEDRMGGARATDRFWRVFLAPGADHCNSGEGPAPTDPLAAVVDWVEKGRAPDTLPAAMTTTEGRTITRNLCRYPLVSRYTGHGDPGVAASFNCVTPSERDPAQR